MSDKKQTSVHGSSGNEDLQGTEASVLGAVDSHRKTIRTKLGLEDGRNQKVVLKEFLVTKEIHIQAETAELAAELFVEIQRRDQSASQWLIVMDMTDGGVQDIEVKGAEHGS